MNKAQIDFEDFLDRVQTEPGVSGIVVIKNDGDSDRISIVRSTLHNTETALRYANMTKRMSNYAKNVVRNLDPTNDLLVLRMGTKHHEIIVAHEQEFIVTVLQAVQNSAVSPSES